MDKYRRNDDINDDLGVYNRDEYSEGISIIGESVNYQQPLKVFGRSDSESEFIERLNKAKRLLTGQETKLLDIMITNNLSIRRAAKRMGISQQMASKYWKRIRNKLA